MYRQGLPASVTPERGEPCYYAKAVAPPRGCLQRSNVDMVMVGKRATPKWRRVCEACWAWLLQERLANVAPPYVTVSPPDLASDCGAQDSASVFQSEFTEIAFVNPC